jgi:hypothetical protein
MLNDYERAFANDEWAGIRWAYTSVSWSDIEMMPGSYDFSGLDGLVSSAHRHGVNLMFQVQTGGDFVMPGPAQAVATGGYRTNSRRPVMHSSAPRNLQGPMAFWRALARRYMPHGDLAREQRWRDSYAVRYFEVENEPDALPWVTGNWSNVPKDYALYVTLVRRTLRAMSPELRVVGPALSSGPDGTGCCGGLSWLDQILMTPGDLGLASDDYRSAVAAGQPVVGAGPSIDVYSFHDDFYDASSPYSVDRAQAVRATVRRFSQQARYATSANPKLWMTEGGPPIQPDDVKSARRQAQVTIRLIANGVTRLNFDVAALRSADASARATNPVALEARAMTELFPSNAGVLVESARLSAAARNAVEAYSSSAPGIGLRSWILWAPDEPSGSGVTGPAFTVPVPIRTNHALLIEGDWMRRDVSVHGGAVRVSLQRADPSAVVMVAERP